MRFGIRPFAIVSLFALLLGGQLCMILECAATPRKAASAHACCAATAAKAPVHAPRPAAGDCERPCCSAVSITPAPVLERPIAHGLHDAIVLAIAAASLDAADLSARTSAPPGETASPPASPPRSAAASRAPPMA